LIENDFKRGQVDTTLFRRTLEKDILVVQIYVDDLIFGSKLKKFVFYFYTHSARHIIIYAHSARHLISFAHSYGSWSKTKESSYYMVGI